MPKCSAAGARVSVVASVYSPWLQHGCGGVERSREALRIRFRSERNDEYVVGNGDNY